MGKKLKKRRKKRKPIFVLTKRRKLLIVTLFSSVGFLGLSVCNRELYRYIYIGLMSFATGGLTLWALKDDLKGANWRIVPILPILFNVAVSLFYFLLPARMLTKLVLVMLFGIGMYAILLSENIFSVSALRTIQLLRAGQALGFLFSLIVAFLLFDTVFSFYLNPFYNGLIMFFISIPVCLQGVWSCSLEEKISKEVWSYVGALAFVIGQGAIFVSMWPVNVMVSSLFLVTILYVGLGLIQQYFVGRLFKKTIVEYMRVGVLVFLILLIVAKW